MTCRRVAAVGIEGCLTHSGTRFSDCRVLRRTGGNGDCTRDTCFAYESNAYGTGTAHAVAANPNDGSLVVVGSMRGSNTTFNCDSNQNREPASLSSSADPGRARSLARSRSAWRSHIVVGSCSSRLLWMLLCRAGVFDGFMTKLRALDGAIIWQRQIGTTPYTSRPHTQDDSSPGGAGDVKANAVVVNPNDNTIIVAGACIVVVVVVLLLLLALRPASAQRRTLQPPCVRYCVLAVGVGTTTANLVGYPLGDPKSAGWPIPFVEKRTAAGVRVWAHTCVDGLRLVLDSLVPSSSPLRCNAL